MNLIVDIIASIRTLFTKQPNTIYEVRLMYKQNAKKVNIFFEYYKKVQARRLQQCGRLVDEYRLQIPTSVQQIHGTTGLTIQISI